MMQWNYKKLRIFIKGEGGYRNVTLRRNCGSIVFMVDMYVIHVDGVMSCSHQIYSIKVT